MLQVPFLKRCSRCRKQKWNSSFSKGLNRDGYQSWCKDCDSGRFIAPEQIRRKRLKYKYGITLTQYELMLKSQNGVCLTCKQLETAKDQNGKIQPLSVDHCHLTGKIRGLLCRNCNQALGATKDNPEVLRALAYHIERNRDA